MSDERQPGTGERTKSGGKFYLRRVEKKKGIIKPKKINQRHPDAHD
jgi:hypothetical protein